VIEQLKALSKLDALGSKNTNPKELNSTLPIKIEVVSKLYGIKYMLKMGNVETVTKSLKELDVGRTYWAMMQRTNIGSITLSNLTPQPKILEFSKFFSMDLAVLEKASKGTKESFFSAFKQEVLNKLAASVDRNEFWLWTNVMLSLQQGVFTLPFRYDEKEHLLQLRKRAAKDIIDFYAVFPNLGEIDGLIKQFNNELFLELRVQFPSVKKYLEKNANELNGVLLSKIEVIKDIKALFSFNNSLLDLKG